MLQFRMEHITPASGKNGSTRPGNEDFPLQNRYASSIIHNLIKDYGILRIIAIVSFSLINIKFALMNAVQICVKSKMPYLLGGTIVIQLATV